MAHSRWRKLSSATDHQFVSRRQFLTRSAQLLGASAALLAFDDRLAAPDQAYAQVYPSLIFMPQVSTATNLPPVPSQYSALASELDSRLSMEVVYLNTVMPQPKMPRAYAAALSNADPNSVTALLNPYAFQGICNELDALQGLGISAIGVSLAYPLLDPSFPNNAGYLSFYTQVANEVKRRGMTLSIANGILLTDPSHYGGVSYGNHTVDSFFAGRTAQAQIIVQNMAPDYITLGAEPTTDQQITGLTFNATRYMQYINDTLARVPRGKIQYCAGAGSWDDLSYWNSLMTGTSLDNGDIHIFPLASTYTDFFQRAVQMTDIARSNRKGVIITQCSLFKASALEVMNGLSHNTIYARDIYDFWQPYDTKFLYLMQQFCQVNGVKFMTYFFSKYLSQSYLPCTAVTQNYTYTQGMHATGQAYAASITAKTYSSTGDAYSVIVKGP